jgi:SpoIIAA-like
MIDSTLDTAHSILVLHPRSALAADDFANLAKTVDPFLEKTGALAGIVIETPSFPGWEGLGAMAAHIRFVRDHHRRVKKVAVVTDSALGKVAEKLASHFVAAEIRQFPAGQMDAAKQWITGGA